MVKFLLHKTKGLRKKAVFKEDIIKGIKWILKDLFPSISTFFGEERVLLKAIGKIHTIVPVVPGDYDLLKKKYPKNIMADMFHMKLCKPANQRRSVPAQCGK